MRFAVLEMFKDLSIRGDPAQLDAFINDVSAHLAPGWSRHLEGEKNLREMALSVEDHQYAFRRKAGNGLPAAGLFLIRRQDRLDVTNIVPQQARELSKAQYNAILDEFVDRNARPAAGRLGLMIELTPDRRPITHWLSEEAARRLRSFSGAANKGTGSSHPMDFQRWAAFLIQVHREEAALDSGTLQRWLIEEEGWPEEKAIDLTIEFEFARDLLKAYDAER